MRDRLRALVREPLVHFAILGALVFAIAKDEPNADDNTIVVDAAVRQRIAAEATARTGTAPDAEELERLVHAWVEEEMLYREGLALGLDRDDPVIRRRIVQTVQFVQQSGEPIPEPTQEDLQAFLDEHAARYAGAPRYDFVQIVVPHTGDADGVRARQWLAALQGGQTPESLGGRVGKSRRFTLDNAAGTFGPELARTLRDAEPGAWILVEQPTARTLLRVDGVAQGETPPLERVRNRVQLDWKEMQKDAIVRRGVEAIAERYSVEHVP